LYSVYDQYKDGIPEECAKFAESKFLKDLDAYGYKKLEAECYFNQQCTNFVALRLPDVVGPFDETERMMKYVLWFQNYI
jgi:nucleoside-diphosphate-sugar epimerase